jgi:tRNA dimethylallyltransferase
MNAKAKKNIIIIAGPTASGKTAVGIEIAKRLNGEIISADSMQIYKYMDIGSAKPTKEEMQEIPHHMIDVIFPQEEFSVAVFRKMVTGYIDEITEKNKLPIIVGGTGLYINSLTRNLDFTEISFDLNYRNELTEIALNNGNEHLHKMLEAVDVESYQRLFPNDVKRVIRALEVYKHTGKTITEYQKESKARPIDYNLAYVGLNMDRQTLYNRINMRVDKMFDMGILDEVTRLKDMGYQRNMVSMQGIGYKEIFDYLDGVCTLEEVKDKIKQFSRNYAKRQLTWFKRDERINWVNIDEYTSFEEMIENIITYIEGKFKFL